MQTPVYTYQTITESSEGYYHESGSKFLAYVGPLRSKDDFESFLTVIKSEHPRARHHCYAYRLLDGNEIVEYSSDAGEPSGSAGQPILGELKRNELLNVGAVVVRYFGGTKLGIPGLIHAYRESTSQAINAGSIIERSRMVSYHWKSQVKLQPKLYDAAKHVGIDIDNPVYTDGFEATLSVPMADHEEMIRRLVTRLSGTDGEMEALLSHLNVTLTCKGEI